MASWRRTLARALDAPGQTGSWARRYAAGLGDASTVRGSWSRRAALLLAAAGVTGCWPRQFGGDGAVGGWDRRKAESAGGQGGGGTSGPPPGSLAYADFEHDVYYDGPTPIALAEVIIDPSFVQHGRGLVNTHASGPGATGLLHSTFHNALNSGSFTFVIDFSWGAAMTSGPIALEDRVSFTHFFTMDRVASLGGNPPYHVEVGDEDDTGNGFSRTVTTVATVALDTPCRVAITRTPAHLAIALNGAEIATDDTAFPVGSMSMNKFGIGGALNGGFPDFNDLVVTRFAIYAAQSDAATLALSAAS